MSSEKITVRIMITPGQWDSIKQVIGEIPDVHEVVLINAGSRPAAQQHDNAPLPKGISGPTAKMKGF